MNFRMLWCLVLLLISFSAVSADVPNTSHWNSAALESYKQQAEIKIYLVLIRAGQTSRFILGAPGDRVTIGFTTLCIDMNKQPRLIIWGQEEQITEQQHDIVKMMGGEDNRLMWMVGKEPKLLGSEMKLFLPSDERDRKEWNKSWISL